MHMQLLELSNYEFALIGWIFGGLWAMLLPFYLKIRAGTLTWRDFNYGYLINFFTSLAIGIGASLLIFAVWIIPEGSVFTIIIIAFGTSAGLDSTVIKQILKVIGLFEKIEERRLASRG